MLEELKEQVYNANLELVRRGVVIYTWGNVSGIGREEGLVVFKPSGISYDEMKPDDMVVVDLKTGKEVPGIAVKSHGPLSWAKDAVASVYHAVVMETVAEMDLKTLILNPNAEMQQYILDKRYLRKHGLRAYYGQV